MQPGDIVLCHSKGVIGAAIRFAERHDAANKYAKWNHVAVLDREENGVWYIIQAEAKGVTNDKTLESVAPGGTYEVLTLPVGADREKFLAFARSQVGATYGYLSILSCALDMVLPDKICLRQADTWICSGLVAGALMFAGYEAAQKWVDIYTVTPAQIALSIAA